MLYSVVKKKYFYYALAILLHAAIDFPAVFAQKGLISMPIMEGVVVAVAVIALVFILRSRKLFPAPISATAAASITAPDGATAAAAETAPGSETAQGRPGDSSNS